MGNLLVGRHGALETLSVRLAPQGGSAVVYGEAGVGKTSLVRTALADRPSREGGCLATLSWSPYLPLRRAFVDDLTLDTWTGDTEYVADRVQTALGDDVLFVDDAQEADVETLRVLEALDGHVRVVTTIRRGTARAATVLNRLAPEPAARIDLDPLGTSDAEALARVLQPRLGGTEVAELVARSGGNPLLIEELATGDRGTASLELAVLARCRELSEDQLEGLALLTLAGHPLELAAIAEADGLVESGLVVDSNGIAAIRHALIGEVIGTLFSEERRVRCHRRLAALVPHPGEQAVHLLAAGDRDAAHAAAVRAVDQATTPGERVAHLVTAAQCADADAGAELRLQAAEAAVEIDEVDLAAGLLDGLPGGTGPPAPPPPPSPPLSAGGSPSGGHAFRIARVRGRIAYFLGQDEAYTAARKVMYAAAAPGTEEEVKSLSSQSTMAFWEDGDNALAGVLAERAMALADRIGAGRSVALKALGELYEHLGDDRWRELMPAALAQARVEDDLNCEGRMAEAYIIALEFWGPLTLGLELATTMRRRFAEERMLSLQRNFAIRELSLAAALGQYSVVAEQGPALLASRASAAGLIELAHVLATTQFALGLVDDALTTTDFLRDHGSSYARSNFHHARAVGFLETGEHHRVLEEETAFRAVETDDRTLDRATPTFAWAAWSTGTTAPPAPSTAYPSGLLAAVGPELAGIDALRAEEPDRAAPLLGEAGGLYHDFERRSAVRCRWGRAEALRLAGDPAAEAALLEVEREATELGLVGAVRRCEKSLRALGVIRSAAAARVAGSVLTSRELEVVGLVAAGLTDAAIAARLGITPRTVKALVANARTKTGAENRRHLVALVAELGR